MTNPKNTRGGQPVRKRRKPRHVKDVAHHPEREMFSCRMDPRIKEHIRELAVRHGWNDRIVVETAVRQLWERETAEGQPTP